jgi:hypothetical protein
VEFRIAASFVDSLADLSNVEQKAVKTAAFDLQMNPASPGMKLHKLDRAKDASFRSVRASRDLRIILHATKESLLLCYAGHHDDAYRWAERRKLEVHPRTGAAQFVEVREKIKEITIPTYVVEKQPAATKPPLFAETPDNELLRYGVPAEWLEDVKAADEDNLLDLTDHLPAVAAAALLELATGGSPELQGFPSAEISPFDHPDAQRRFRKVGNLEQLKTALDYPWEKWTVFLHPQQQRLVEGDYGGPARVAGSAGTGKTIVALHRAVHLAQTHPDARVLLATFSRPLANMLRDKLIILVGDKPRLAESLEVVDLEGLAERLYGFAFGTHKIATKNQVRTALIGAGEELADSEFTPRFLMAEWEHVVDAWQLSDWDEYRDVLRLGRRVRLPESRRRALWSIFQKVRQRLGEQGLVTYPEVFTQLANHYRAGNQSPFDFIVVDEAQDLSVSELRFLAALAGDKPNGLFFTGDLGQRIFRQPFSWKSLGVDVRGRSYTLKVNYRTSHQIRMQADRLLDPEISDVDGIPVDRQGTVSVFNGPSPVVLILETEAKEIENVGAWLSDRRRDGVLPHELGVIVRSDAQLPRARSALESSGLAFTILGDDLDIRREHVSICTMHLAKGLEFRAVAVMACDDEVVPLQERIEAAAEESELEEVYNTERHLLYVACTRARDQLLVTGVAPGSEFLEDMAQ